MRKKTLLIVILGGMLGCGRTAPPSAGEAPEAPLRQELRGRVAYQSNEDGAWEIWVMQADGGGKKKLTENAADDEYPRWSPDGRRIAFVSNRDGDKEIYCVEVASAKAERLTFHPAEDLDPDWAPDGTRLVFTSRRDGKDDLYELELADKKVTRLTEGAGRNALASWSSDGKKIAFSSNRVLGWSVYVLDLETRETRKVVSGHGACRPRWSRDGNELALVSQQADGKGDIFIVRPDGTELRRVTQTSATYDYFPSWVQEKWIVFARTENKKRGPWDLYAVNVLSGEEKRLTQTPFSESFPDWTEK